MKKAFSVFAIALIIIPLPLFSGAWHFPKFYAQMRALTFAGNITDEDYVHNPKIDEEDYYVNLGQSSKNVYFTQRRNYILNGNPATLADLSKAFGIGDSLNVQTLNSPSYELGGVDYYEITSILSFVDN